MIVTFSSPSQGPCCSGESCTFVPQAFNQECRAETNCSWNSHCDGRTAECPDPSHKANKTRCNEDTQVKNQLHMLYFSQLDNFHVAIANFDILSCIPQLCINGECSGSICLEWNLTECFLTSSLIPNIDKRQLCVLACQNGTNVTSCRSTSEFAHQVGLPPGGISLRPGSPCDNFQV